MTFRQTAKNHRILIRIELGVKTLPWLRRHQSGGKHQTTFGIQRYDHGVIVPRDVDSMFG
jgi:hypothetical protein